MPLCTNCMKQVQSLRTLPGTRGQKHICTKCWMAIVNNVKSPTQKPPVQKIVQCFRCGKIISNPLSGSLNSVYQFCGSCTSTQRQASWQLLQSILYGYQFKINNPRTSFFGMPYGKSFAQFLNNFDEVEEMPKATLSYEALQLDSEGIPTEGAYKLKLEGNFKTHIEPIVKFIKASIPSSDRTYDPNTYEWAFHERFWPLMEQAFKGSHFQVSFTVRKEDFVELKRKQAEFAKQAGQSFATRQVPVEEDIKKFTLLLCEVKTIDDWIGIDIVRNWTKEQAVSFYKKAIRFFHPDLHPERAAQASELNEVWSRLKEGYYIK